MNENKFLQLIRQIIKEEIDAVEKPKSLNAIQNTSFTPEESRLLRKYFEKHGSEVNEVKFVKNSKVTFKKTVPKLFDEKDEKMQKVIDFMIFKQLDVKDNTKINYIVKASFNETGKKQAQQYKKIVKLGLFEKEDLEKLHLIFKKLNVWKWS